VPSRTQLELRVAGAFGGAGEGAVWQAPAIFALSQWAADLSSRIDLLSGRAAPVAPDRFELGRLWQESIATALPGIGPRERDALARQARGADRLIRQWVPGEDLRSAHGDFRAWSETVADGMRERGWRSPEGWIDRLADQVRGCRAAGPLLPEAVQLAGFVELTALERRLVAALEEAGVAVELEEARATGSGDALRHSFATPERELSGAARWAARRVERGDRRVAVIVHGLDAAAGSVRRIFENHLQPAAVFALQDGTDAPFRISRGEPLASSPLVNDALLLLKLAASGPAVRHDFPRISRLLLSRNWAGGHTEAFARARLESRLRERGVYRWSLDAIVKFAAGCEEAGELRVMTSCIDRLREVREGHPARQLLDWLARWGWPGDTACAGLVREDQARFLGLLERLSRYPFRDTGDCLAHLVFMCGASMAAGPGGAFSPIQVLTPEEAYGLSFDSAWIANLTAENWPPRPVGNPLLDARILRRIPRADAAGMLDYAERLTGALRSCAPVVRFSWCDRLEDLSVSASPLVSDIEHAPVPGDTACTLGAAMAPETAGIVGYREHPWLADAGESPGTPYPGHRDRKLPAAVKVLNYQSACPLAGFLVARLGAWPLEAPTPFADPAAQGGLLHLALERLYRPRLGSGRPPQAGSVPGAVSAALRESRAERWLLPAELAATRENLVELLRGWLIFERDWAGGVAEKLEWREELPFEDFAIGVRIDRANRLDDGRLFLLDYKSGRPATGNAWAEERPGDVQLPLYAVLLAEAGVAEVAGLATAHVNAGHMMLRGISGDEASAAWQVSGFTSPQALGKPYAGWEDAIRTWRSRLAALCREISGGECRLQVFRREALQYADLEILLRQEESERWRREHAS
jgi:ATP-dependent helicase/nuclease subunit B